MEMINASELLAALGHETRLAIFRMLVRGWRSLEDSNLQGLRSDEGSLKQSYSLSSFLMSFLALSLAALLPEMFLACLL